MIDNDSYVALKDAVNNLYRQLFVNDLWKGVIPMSAVDDYIEVDWIDSSINIKRAQEEASRNRAIEMATLIFKDNSMTVEQVRKLVRDDELSTMELYELQKKVQSTDKPITPSRR